MELDRWDNLYVSDGINARIQKFSSDGKFLKSMKVFIFDDNDFEIVNDKLYYRISFPKKINQDSYPLINYCIFYTNWLFGFKCPWISTTR